ncbi:biopolymer transporter ExbD [Flavobacterium sp.]|uniref:biopolymer transporter ExbD n=1 Tax=Flavobacterium sp. TaxID=239 RepID=UPI003F69EB81
MFFRTKDNDTIIEVNRQNTIGTTNWIYSIDKRLPLKLVVPEIIKLQEKKKNSSHKKEGAIEVFSYADSIGKNLAFVPFTEIDFKTQKPKSGIEIYISKNNQVIVDGKKVPNNDLERYLEEELTVLELSKTVISIDKDANYELFLNVIINIQMTEIKRNYPTIYIY